MPDRSAPGNVTCPRCRKRLTAADEIAKNPLQLLLAPNRRHYHCGDCGLDFTISTTSRQRAMEATPAYELPPLRFDSLASGWKPAETPHRSPRYVRTRPRTTRLHVTDVPDIPGIHNSAEKAALKRPVPPDRSVEQELERLRRIEKKYRQLKKANRYLAKASSQRR